MDKLLKKYNSSIADVNSLKKEVKKKLDKYDASQKEAKKQSHEEQEDGWIKVHNKGSRDPTKKFVKGKKVKKNRKKKNENLLNFYAFEVREAKLKKHKELLEKFEEDKRRLAKMREQRKFKI